MEAEVRKKPSKKKAEEVVSIESNDFNFDYIVEKWKSFVEEITNEKSLFLSHAITDVKLNSLNGNNLLISIPNSESIKTFSMHEKYLENRISCIVLLICLVDGNQCPGRTKAEFIQRN